MSVEDNVQVCAILRNFKSDSEYLHFGNFWIEKLTEDDRCHLSTKLRYFTNYWGDNHIAATWYYIGRGKSSTVLRDNHMMFFFPLFRAMKLFRKGDLIIPSLFCRWKDKWLEMQCHGDSFGLGSRLLKEDEPYILQKDDVEEFNVFMEKVKTYLRYIEFPEMPYLKKHRIMKDIDTRCFLPLHILLKGSVEHHNPFPEIDTLIDYTLALESLYLFRHEDIGRSLSSRLAVLLGKDESEEQQFRRDIKKFYDIRSAIVHGSLMSSKQYEFLRTNIYNYGEYLRKSILAFLDLNATSPSKKAVIEKLDQAMGRPGLKAEIKESLNLLRMSGTET